MRVLTFVPVSVANFLSFTFFLFLSFFSLRLLSECNASTEMQKQEFAIGSILHVQE